MGASIRLGCVQYLNALPLIHGWPGEILYRHPAELCRELHAGNLDVALVSSFEYLRHPVYAAVDGLAIGSDGPVFSVILAYRGALEILREVILDPASETSAKLLLCLFGDQPIEIVGGGEISETRGQLLIGDQALRFRAAAGKDFQILDLGEAWKKMTNLPFVYALWLIRPGCAAPEEIAEQLRSLGNFNLSNLDAVIATKPPETRDFCQFYLRQCLHYRLAAEEKRGFEKFAELCAQKKLIPAVPPPPRYL